MTTKLNSLHELLHDQLKDLFNAENQLVKALPKVAKAASSPLLTEAINHHLEETRQHVERLNEIGSILELKLTGKKCAAMEGLIEEAKEVLQADGEPAVLDSAIIAGAQRIEHYEIAAYGTARTYAEALGLEDVVELLQQTLDEEGNADKTLTTISVEELLPEACSTEEEEEEADEEPTPTQRPTRRRMAGTRGR